MIQPTDQPTTTASLRTRKERLLCAMPAHPNIYQPLDPTRLEIQLLMVGTASQMAGWNSRHRQAAACNLSTDPWLGKAASTKGAAGAGSAHSPLMPAKLSAAPPPATSP